MPPHTVELQEIAKSAQPTDSVAVAAAAAAAGDRIVATNAPPSDTQPPIQVQADPVHQEVSYYYFFLAKEVNYNFYLILSIWILGYNRGIEYLLRYFLFFFC